MRPSIAKILTLAALGTASAAALAHPGSDGGLHDVVFMDGLLHPLTGADHMAAMLAVGLWSAMTATSARRVWFAPLAFAGMLLVGALLGLDGVALPAVEPMIAASLLVLGLLVASQARLPAMLAAGIVGVFAIFHGIAHGTELAGGTNGFTPLLGMLIATLGLHLAGVGLGLALRRHSAWWPRVVGGLVTLLGGAFLLQLV
ncbi:urease accessory protein UreJ [Rhodoferax koreense]|uniref:Urease accessory protein UreJ n=1 Tax=Rhodoferax koreensis TaxID=1842727 RepID=A0A1P8JYQ3_9BURK|nr:HupE/UreJ family protein [Rhodoferax koreense]APW38875.1 urease accessory protein UreJ [Rhodoferax koreense]